MKDRNSKLKPIKGLIPDPTIIQKGCSFAERCPYAKQECFDNGNEEKWMSSTHMARCKAYNDPLFHIERNSANG
jgi:peptide/nickel transport system ATP-binding protein